MSQGVECYSCLPKTAWPPTWYATPNGATVTSEADLFESWEPELGSGDERDTGRRSCWRGHLEGQEQVGRKPEGLRAGREDGRLGRKPEGLGWTEPFERRVGD